MKVADLMSRGALTCRPDDHLAAAAQLMWDGDCGMVPVAEDGQLVGVITDRDICMGMVMQTQRADQIPVDRVMNPKPKTCSSSATLKDALEIMKTHRVRRLPVVDEDGQLEGVLSINDVILEAKASGNRIGAPTYAQVVTTLRHIGQHRDVLAVV